MVSRLCHLITDQFDVPTSEAISSRVLHKAMTERNEVMSESADMSRVLGHDVPICKGIMVRDIEFAVGHSGPMAKDVENLAESAWQKAFQERLSRIQGKRTHEAMAEFLEMPVESWKKCVNRGDSFPIRKLPRLALLAGIPVESLIKGDRDDELPAAVQRYRRKTKAITRKAS